MILNKLFYKKYKINLEKPGSPLILLIKRDAYHALALLCTIIKNQDGSIKTKEQIDQLIDFLKKEENQIIKKKFLNELKKSFYVEWTATVNNQKKIIYCGSSRVFHHKQKNQGKMKIVFSSSSHVFFYLVSIIKQHKLYDEDKVVSFMHLRLQNKYMLEGQRIIFRLENKFFIVKSLTDSSENSSFWRKIVNNLKHVVTIKNKFQKDETAIYDTESMQAFNSVIYEVEQRIASAALQNPVVNEFTWQLYVLQLAYLSEIFIAIIKNFNIDTISTAVVAFVDKKFVYESLQDIEVAKVFADIEHFLFIHYQISILFNKDEETALRVVVYMIQQFREYGLKREKYMGDGENFNSVKNMASFENQYVRSIFARTIDQKFFDHIHYLLPFQREQEDVIGNFLWPDSVEDVTNSIFIDFVIAFVNAFTNQFF